MCSLVCPTLASFSGRAVTKFLKVALVMCVVAGGACKFTPSRDDRAAHEVHAAAEQFTRLETSGRWLGPENWNDLSDYFQETRPWSPPQSISLLKTYSMGLIEGTIYANGKPCYLVEMDYQLWGTIDSFLHFRTAETATGQPTALGRTVFKKENEEYCFADEFVRRGESETGEKKKGALRWRVAWFPAYGPKITVDAALRYVVEKSDKSTDPLTRYNAARTLAMLRQLSTGVLLPPPPVNFAPQSAEQTASQFLELESHLALDRGGKLADFYMETPPKETKEIQVVDGPVVAPERPGPKIARDTTDIFILADSLGTLDADLRLTDYPRRRPGSACYFDLQIELTMVLSDVHWEVAPDGTAKQINGPFAWRFESSYFLPFITLDTAIHYVLEKGRKTSDAAVRRNAERTLAIFRAYQNGQPLPDYLCMGASGGCTE
jgi:hypothetical protein